MDHQANDLTTQWKSSMDIVQSRGFFQVLETHIALAILNASCEMYCNPEYKMRVISTPKSQSQLTSNNRTALAPETEAMMDESEQSKEHFSCCS
jgi:hypothetical protein